MLEGIDVLLVDYQDIGARYWTYASTMTLAMEAAGEAEIPVVVLDRPNPIGGATQGNILLPRFGTFVGRFPIPMRHGMTPGELARYSSGEFGIEVDLHVAPAEGWSRDMTFAETRLPWIQPSPNMPDIESATHYPGTCLFEGTRLSVARGTDRPFQQVGAPWLDGEALARTMNGYGLSGVRFEPVHFTPVSPGDGKFDGVEVEGVRLIATSTEYDPTHAALALLVETHRMSAEKLGMATVALRPARRDRPPQEGYNGGCGRRRASGGLGRGSGGVQTNPRALPHLSVTRTGVRPPYPTATSASTPDLKAS